MKYTLPRDRGLKFARTLYTKSKPKAKAKESSIQQMVETFLICHDIRFIRIPDTAYRALFSNTVVPLWIKKDLSKCLKGVPDLICLRPNGEYNDCLLLEIKTEAGKVSQGQKQFAKGLSVKYGYGYKQCIEIIEGWMHEIT